MTAWVNNAGVGMTRNVLDLSEEDVDIMIAANFKSVLFGMQAALPYFKTVGSGHLINVSSMLARIPFASFRAMYSASKAAVNSITVSARCDLAAEGHSRIRVALFTPGVVQTPFGVNSIGGGPDNRELPGAQPVGEVADVLMRMLAAPGECVDRYSRPAYQAVVTGYYAAPDVRELEGHAPFATLATASSTNYNYKPPE